MSLISGVIVRLKVHVLLLSTLSVLVLCTVLLPGSLAQLLLPSPVHCLPPRQVPGQSRWFAGLSTGAILKKPSLTTARTPLGKQGLLKLPRP